ncbi:MAG TPA: succinyldiaminopimelate transaminase [Acidimicrobiales bacterium]|nr:succinyldiaminopimelate transaminase [Acidimicrobiales bacterium]
MTGARRGGFEPPPYPYDRLDRFRALADEHEGGVVDLSVGTPTDAPPPAAVVALGSSDAERGYPPSVGTAAFRAAATGWMQRRLGVEVAPEAVAACIGTKEFVAGVPQWLRLRDPARDTVLYPAVAYPTYEMGAILADCRAVAVGVDDAWRLDLSTVSADDAARALCLWVNTPANPTGALDDLADVAEWGRAHDVPVFSDECYIELTWDGPPRTILANGRDGFDGLVAVHSLSKRSNLAGLRVGFYAGDPELVHYLSEVRKHAGFMTPGPIQAAAVAALGDDAHVDEQRRRYAERLRFFRDVLARAGIKCDPPGGSFYLWAEASDGDAWAATEMLARDGGVLVSPGDFYGAAGASHLRIAMVQPLERLELVADRLAAHA